MPPSKDRKRPKLDPLRPFPSKATKKKLKDKAELELESLVFGGDDEAQVKGIWERAGHELSDGEEDDEEDEKAEGGSSTEQGLANDVGASIFPLNSYQPTDRIIYQSLLS